MKTQGHRFTIGAGEVVEHGKTHWPDFVRLYLPRDQALTFAMNILRQLEYARPDASPTFEIPLFGEMIRVEEDDLDSASN